MSQYFKIPKSNSIRYSRIRLLNELKNDDNTLSGESINDFPYINVQKYITTDVITTQFRSNYTTNSAKITDENSIETSLTVTKKTTNIGREKRYDGHYYNYKSGGVYTGIYFTVGNEYTYGTTTIIGTHTINGSLAEFGIIGQSVEIVGVGTYTIDRLVYDEDVDANVILVTRTHSGVGVSGQIQSQYDLLPYDVYEFYTDFSAFLNEVFITITVTDPFKRTLVAKSEQIDVQLTQPNTLNIIYYNDINTELLYSTGIQNKIRPLYYKVKAVSDNDNEINLTDNSSVVVNANVYEKNKFFFRELSNERMRQLKIALSSKNVIINEDGYTIDGQINDEYIENTNLYLLDATLNKTGENFYVDERLALADAHKARVDALTGGEVVSFQCLLNEYDTNY